MSLFTDRTEADFAPVMRALGEAVQGHLDFRNFLDGADDELHKLCNDPALAAPGPVPVAFRDALRAFADRLPPALDLALLRDQFAEFTATLFPQPTPTGDQHERP
jgi:hypothetical protein